MGNLVALLLALLDLVGPIIARSPEFIQLYEQFVQLLDKDTDQAEARSALEALRDENDAGYLRLRQKLLDASHR